MSDTIMSLLMLAGVALTGGAVYIFRTGDRRRGLLMFVAALVMFANVVIWLIPTE